ncbi:Asp-tRNA(Asn)/Glu-tRNA(Gln) amidotransferase GatCAB subunit A [Caenibacillus caldisaponilyticus]|uniref:Asp-tRNA(Asn)/Glu-tRNA(Gln) amidotransferase GatCAB subunit A n=1 Tax=Caenibacillus caldisaponilyticus TaxID=1674942 RepID=UPI0009887079|nr:Asp-tRNA(Asn)/Glu-tRNA(Gln) amidotransferase GatCAB subunit A [Caenibacillus caldisaponilyticus]
MDDLLTLAQKIRARQISPVEITERLLKKIEAQNPALNAFITVAADEALAAAKKAEQELYRNTYRGPLHGIPIGIKDMIETKGLRTTMGSGIFKDYIPEKDAAVVQKLKEAGAVILGKLHTHEFAYGPMGDRSYFGPARNPHDRHKIAGGSSSGAGAAVAAGLCYGAVGTDTGGSVRIPASCCGVVGLKPTYGRVAVDGVFPLSYSLDHVGPLTRTVLDNAALFQAMIHGVDLNETWAKVEKVIADFDLSKTVIAIPDDYFLDDVDDEVQQAFADAIQSLEAAGAQIRSISLPDLESIRWAQPIVQKSEAYAIHEKWIEARSKDYDPEVYERLLEGKQPKGYEYVRAIRMREEITQQVEACFKTADVLMTPTLPILPTNIDQRELILNGKTLKVRSALLKNTSPWNYTGHPALSVPCGRSKTGLPIGLQIIGPLHQEIRLYAFARQIERVAAAV